MWRPTQPCECTAPLHHFQFICHVSRHSRIYCMPYSRPIALNGWVLHLCPLAAPDPQPTGALPTTTTTPPTIAAVPSPSPVPAPVTPPITGVTGFSGPQQPPKSTTGWQVVYVNPLSGSATQQQIQAMQGAPQDSASTSGNTGIVVPPINPADPFGIQTFKANFDAYLRGRFGAACTDPTCANIKMKFWKATLGLIYLKARLDGKLAPGEIADKLASLIPGVRQQYICMQMEVLALQTSCSNSTCFCPYLMFSPTLCFKKWPTTPRNGPPRRTRSPKTWPSGTTSCSSIWLAT